MTAPPTPPCHERIKLADLRDGDAQARIEINEATVADYAADMASGTIFPPVVIYFDGTDYWLGKNRAGDDD